MDGGIGLSDLSGSEEFEKRYRCPHDGWQSGLLQIDVIGNITAYLRCDDCGGRLRLLEDPTIDARAAALYPSYLAAFHRFKP